MAKYKVGDKVRIVKHRTAGMSIFGVMDKWLGKTMTIRRILPLGYLMVEDREENCCEGWYWTNGMIAGLAEPMPERRRDYDLKVVIRFDGNITTARMIRGGTVVKTATARRNPADKYSRAEGARVAVERLFEKTSGKPKIGDKFVVVGRSAFHRFDIDTIVTLIHLECDGCNQYRDDFGLCQYVSDRDVKPYKEKTT